MAVFTNQATLNYNGITVNSNTVTGNLVEVLAVTKTSVGDSYAPNETVTYIISITNSGTAAFSGVTVTDNLGAYTFGADTLVPLDYVTGSAVYYQNGILQTAPTISSAQPLTFTGITVPAGGNATLVYEVKTNGFAPLTAGSTITNEATVSATGITAPLTDTETVTIESTPILSITKSLSPVNVTENSELTYSFVLQNTGNTAAEVTDNVVISDVFNPILSGISVTVNDSPLPTAGYTYDETTGEFSTVAGAVTVPAATYTQNPTTGEWVTTPGVTTITITGTV